MTDDEICRLQAEHLARPASEYRQAGKFHSPPDVPEHEPQNAHSLILEAFKRPASLPDGVFSLDKSVPKHQGRGRPISRSRYDNFIEKLKSAIQKQTRLPRLRVGAKKQSSTVEISARAIANLVAQMGNKERVTAPKVWNRLDVLRFRNEYRGPMPSIWTVQKILADLRRRGIIRK